MLLALVSMYNWSKNFNITGTSPQCNELRHAPPIEMSVFHEPVSEGDSSTEWQIVRSQLHLIVSYSKAFMLFCPTLHSMFNAFASACLLVVP